MKSGFIAREVAKQRVRGLLRRWDLGLVRGPYDSQLVKALDWLGIDTVLDVGGNIGQYASSLLDGGFTGRVISCEPLSDAFAELDRRSRKRSSWTAVHTAVGAAPGTITINVSENSYSSSVLSVNETHLAADQASRVIAAEEVALTTVDQLVADLGIKPATTLLKVDTQGYEAPVLDGAAGVLADFAAVQLELSFVPLYESQALFDELSTRLTGVGLRLFSLNPGISDPVSGRLLQADGLFVAGDRLDGADGRKSAS